MKKLLMIVVMAIASLTASAQNVGMNLNFGSMSGRSDVGIGVEYQQPLNGNFRFEPSINYFFKKDYTSMLDINANFHYLFNLGKSGFNFYPILGLGANFWINDGSDNKAWFLLNWGLGLEYPLTNTLKINLEGKDQVHFGDGGGSRWIVSLGLSVAI